MVPFEWYLRKSGGTSRDPQARALVGAHNVHLQRSPSFDGSAPIGALLDDELGHAALRQLSNRLVGILHGCLKTRTLYEEATAWSHHQRERQVA